MNGSPLFTGDAGSGESEIRRFILENDLLEALIALPEQLFYNTGIATYVWVVTNRKQARRKGLVQLVDASTFWVPMRRSLGDKRREIPLDRAQDILQILADFKDGDTRKVAKDGKQEEVLVSRIFPTTHLGFRKITVERPLRLNFQATADVARTISVFGLGSLHFRVLKRGRPCGAP
jgi:type I restriction enzyme M protein